MGPGYPKLDGGSGVGGRVQSSTAYTCYAVCGMPFAFTQEDFLVAAIHLVCLHKSDMLNFLEFVRFLYGTPLSPWRESQFSILSSPKEFEILYFSGNKVKSG